MTKEEYVFLQIHNELKRAQENYPPFNSAHEGYAILLEEVDELWMHVMMKQSRRDYSAMGDEAKQIAAMAIRFYIDCCDKGGNGYGK